MCFTLVTEASPSSQNNRWLFLPGFSEKQDLMQLAGRDKSLDGREWKVIGFEDSVVDCTRTIGAEIQHQLHLPCLNTQRAQIYPRLPSRLCSNGHGNHLHWWLPRHSIWPKKKGSTCLFEHRLRVKDASNWAYWSHYVHWQLEGRWNRLSLLSPYKVETITYFTNQNALFQSELLCSMENRHELHWRHLLLNANSFPGLLLAK